jgi:DNA-binding response OmpR family regulator
MNTDTKNNASAGPPSGSGPRIHRASRAHVKSPRKILVVDDNKVILQTTSTQLKAAGYEVLTAEDGASAIRQARQLQPDLILLDLNFPPDVGHGGGIPWDGFLILSWLRRTNGMEKVPVIVITGGDLEKHKDRWVEAGVQDIFLKPIDHEALLAAIRWALDQEIAEQDPAPTDPFGQPPAEPAPAIEPAARLKVLFVDDTNDWRYLGAAYLGERGYDVVTADDPISAMLQVSQFNPNVVVLDLNLGGQSAVALLKVLSERHPEVRILIYTGMDLDRAEASELLKQGAWNWLRKGSLEDLVTAVEKTISEPKATVLQSAAKPEETAKAPLAGAGSARHAMAERTEAAPECRSAFPSLDDLRTGTTEELLNAVRRARSEALEQTQAVLEPGGLVSEPGGIILEPAGVVPDEMIESAAESILIVEDDAAFADTLRSFLESHSFRVSAVTTGAEALSLIAAVDVDLILFDLTLPDLSVHEFYDAVKAVKPQLCPRIIFMTSDDSHPGDDGFIRRLKGISLWKPFPMDWLLEAVQTVRAGSHQDRLSAK